MQGPLSSHGRDSDRLGSSVPTFSDYQEKMAPPSFPFDEKLHPRFPLSAQNLINSHLDFLPSSSMSVRAGAANVYVEEHPTLSMLPNLKLFPQDRSRCNQHEREAVPTLGLGHTPNMLQSFPENHRKVLENIMMRTSSGSNNMLKKKSRVDTWSEDELDCLWIGVRRHGRGNWDAMLRDHGLKFSKYKSEEDLLVRWEEEQLKIIDCSAFQDPKSTKLTKSTKLPSFLGISGMMSRALHGSRLVAPAKSQSHMTDMKLGLSDLASASPDFYTSDRLGLHNEQSASTPIFFHDKYLGDISRDATARPPDKLGTSNGHIDKPFLLNSLGNTCLGSLGHYCSSSCDKRQKEDEQGTTLCGKFLNLLERSTNILCEPGHTSGIGESTSSALVPDLRSGILNQKIDCAAESNSSKDKLPHWLREAVSIPVRSPDPELPPAVSAIVQSVRLLYGEDKPTIPPFSIPGPPPPLPKDPRRNLKKKKKRKSHPCRGIQEFHSTVLGDSPSSSMPLASRFPLHEEASKLEYDFNFPPAHVNMNPSSSLPHPNQQKRTDMGLSPSPEVLQLVASCVAAGPHTSSVSGMASSSFLDNKLPLPNDVDGVERLDTQGIGEKETKCGLPHKIHLSFEEDKVNDIDSGDSSKTHSDPSRSERPDTEEISSEGTVSDHPE